ncbi:MAG: 3'(2'),5'-bisphosphate nucleotidase CysQ [Lachnospiraceae bacterium]|nr:3'(2'),5'-bisphosphate nucleotidase CysQ [Lachnospiraceae bacterium]MDE7205426.1 3'(2'),5'-bisphosphate nucleotidase CysQ [Lachnospiraceae bacterium]
MRWEKELSVAKEAATEAGKKIIEIYNLGEFGTVYKDDCSPLTLADREANLVIMQKLKQKFPDYAILSEEEKDNGERLKNDYCFIVDPLDGTKEFIKRNGQFTVNIALSYKGKSVMGVIYVPVLEELYWASEKEGAYLSIRGKTERIQVSDRKKDIRVVMSNSHGCAEMDDLIRKNNLVNYVKMGSSLKGCVVAKGDAEIYYRFNPTMEWDTAAMQCIAEEAGAIFMQMDDTPMCYNRENCLNAKGFYIINCLENKMQV